MSNSKRPSEGVKQWSSERVIERNRPSTTTWKISNIFQVSDLKVSNLAIILKLDHYLIPQNSKFICDTAGLRVYSLTTNLLNTKTEQQKFLVAQKL